jgi:hypothetical protein
MWRSTNAVRGIPALNFTVKTRINEQIKLEQAWYGYGEVVESTSGLNFTVKNRINEQIKLEQAW